MTEPLGVLAVLAGIVFLAVQLESRSSVGRTLGSALVGILLAMILSNIGVLPGESSTYDALASHGVGLGVVLILLQVDVHSIRQAGPRMLGAFTIGALGSAVGAVVATVALGEQVGPEAWKLAGQYTGTYIGGGMNFAAVGQALGTSSSLFAAAVAADVIVTALWMALCLMVPVLLGHEMVSPVPGRAATATERPTLDQALYQSGRSVTLAAVATLLAIATTSLWLSVRLSEIVPVPSVLWLTTIALAAAQVPAIRLLPGSAVLGNYAVLLFLAANGAQSVVANIVQFGPAVFYLAALTVAIHGLVIFGAGRAVGLDLPTLAVASQANVGGAAYAMALASARGYHDRVLPGVAVGLVGYAVGNYAGIGVALTMRAWLGGG